MGCTGEIGVFHGGLKERLGRKDRQNGNLQPRTFAALNKAELHSVQRIVEVLSLNYYLKILVIIVKITKKYRMSQEN